MPTFSWTAWGHHASDIAKEECKKENSLSKIAPLTSHFRIFQNEKKIYPLGYNLFFSLGLVSYYTGQAGFILPSALTSGKENVFILHRGHVINWSWQSWSLPPLSCCRSQCDSRITYPYGCILETPQCHVCLRKEKRLLQFLFTSSYFSSQKLTISCILTQKIVLHFMTSLLLNLTFYFVLAASVISLERS